ncbi:MAG: NADH-quinone oxidoreductase subunit A [Anaerolineales bacterium]|jgi:NADH-quinone oxidoreductase subunit A
MTTLGSIVIYFIIVLFIVAAMLTLSYLLGERHQERTTGEAYESGMLPTGSARLRISVKYYLIAMFFVIFDLEAAFIYLWAVSFKELGWAGYLEALIFIGILLSALVYLWRSGALEWGPNPRLRRNPRAMQSSPNQSSPEADSSSEKELDKHELVVE